MHRFLALAALLALCVVAAADPCPKCGQEVEKKWKFCPGCGKTLPDREKEVADATSKARREKEELLDALRELKRACEAAGDRERAGRISEQIDALEKAPVTGVKEVEFEGAAGGGRFGGRVGGREDAVARGGGSKATEQAVEAGLRWLARHQGMSGGWRAKEFSERCADEKCGGEGYEAHDAGVTGLALLAFLGAGYSHLTKDTYVDPITKKTMCFGDVIKSGIKWMLANQDEAGCFGGRLGSKYMYGHAICALAMAEAYGLTGSALFKDAAQRGVDFLVGGQNPGKGWRYSQRSGDSDTSVTGWAVQALKAAEAAGLTVPRSAMQGARAWIAEATDEAFGRVGYCAKGTGKVVIVGQNEDWDHHETLTAAGMIVRMYAGGALDDPMLIAGAKLLHADLPRNEKFKTDYYFWYWGTLALFHFENRSGANWKRWNEAMKSAIVPAQRGDGDGCLRGSWDTEPDRWGFEGGRVYATALNVLTLETYYRSARSAEEERKK